MSDIGEKIANKYAAALFESFSDDQLERVNAALGNLAQVWNEDETIRSVLLSPTVLSTERTQALLEIGKMVAESHQVQPADHISRFLTLVEGNGRIHGLPLIAKCFSGLLSKRRRELQVTVISATPLDDSEKREIEEKVKSGSSSLSKIEWQVDEALIGGMVIRCGDREIDGSVRGAMNGAKSTLLAA
ncbi:MAG: ATP synthase F1 subunit delta [Bdellovibrionales bacterium]|nr:ATP synthase F1 subunit delta [Bdellovibrionales bacterium]